MGEIFKAIQAKRPTGCSTDCPEILDVKDLGEAGDYFFCEAHKQWWQRTVITQNIDGWESINRVPTALLHLLAQRDESVTKTPASE